VWVYVLICRDIQIIDESKWQSMEFIDCCKRLSEETDYCCIQQSFNSPHLFSLVSIEHYVISHASYAACIIFKIRLMLNALLSSWWGGFKFFLL
jgi:hypothetical protein